MKEILSDHSLVERVESRSMARSRMSVAGRLRLPGNAGRFCGVPSRFRRRAACMMRSVSALGLVLSVLLSCGRGKDDASLLPMLSSSGGQGTVQFSARTGVSAASLGQSALRGLRAAAVDPLYATARYALVTLNDGTGSPVADWNARRIDLRAFGESFTTDPQSLPVGSYSLAGFIMYDSGNAAIYAAPVVGSARAPLVVSPLPLAVTVTRDAVTAVSPEVLKVADASPADFGYAGFTPVAAAPISFQVTVLVRNSSTGQYALTTADATIASGTYSQSFPLAASTNLLEVRGVQATYTLTVSKAGYQTFSATYTADQLRAFMANPLEVMLEEVTVPSTTWDTTSRPRITTWDSTTYTVSWGPRSGAVRYNIYSWNTSWVLEGNTTATTQTLAGGNSRKICAVDSSAAELDCKVVMPGVYSAYSMLFHYPTLSGREVSGSFFDDFNDGVVGSAYDVWKSEQAAEAGGYFQLNQNITDQGPNAALLYNRGGNRYLRISWKQLSHRANEYFFGALTVFDMTGINDRYALSMAYKADFPCYGLCQQKWTCDDASAYGSCSGYSGGNLSSAQIFDAWMDLEVTIDFVAGTITPKMDGVAYAPTSMRTDWGNRIGLLFSPGGWYTGHYIRIDDLSIESRATPFP